MSNPIPLQHGINMTALYRIEKEEILLPEYREKNVLAISETFSRKSIEDLLAKEGCEKMRIYYGMDSELKVHAILVAVNANDEDILPTPSLTLTEEEPYLWDKARRCPDDCPPVSPLNP
jgi:hypothetical protein